MENSHHEVVGLDHLNLGTSALERQGYPREEYLTASFGKGDGGHDQVLVMGRNHVAIRSMDGDVILDAGLREIRGVRFVAGRGLQVWVTSRPDLSHFGKQYWEHLLADADAEYLERLWLQTEPFSHTGVQLNRRPWREEEYAYFVGRAVTEAARCDVRLSSGLALIKMRGFQFNTPPRGKSGTQLADLLDEVGAYSEAFRELAERYRCWYKWRNFATHGIRYESEPGKPTSQVFKIKKKPDGTGEDFDIGDQDFEDLALLWSAFYFIGIDGAQLTTELMKQSGDLMSELEALSVCCSVSHRDRLPTRLAP